MGTKVYLQGETFFPLKNKSEDTGVGKLEIAVNFFLIEKRGNTI